MAFVVELGRGQGTRPVDEAYWGQLWSDPATLKKVAAMRTHYDRWWALLKEGKDEQAKAAKAEGDSMKKWLPGFCFSANAFAAHRWVDTKKVDHGVDTWRNSKHVILNGLCMIDVDHVEDPRQLYNQIAALKDEEEIMLIVKYHLLLAYRTPSGHGLKMVLAADIQGDLWWNVCRAAKAFGVEPDKQCKDGGRLSFISGGEDDILYIDNELFTYYDNDYGKKYTKKYNEALGNPSLFAGGETGEPEKAGKDTQGEGVQGFEWSEEEIEAFEAYRFRGFTIAEIVDAYVDVNDVEQGTRHDTLLYLASNLRNITERNNNLIKYSLLRSHFVQELLSEGDPVKRTILDGLNSSYVPGIRKSLQRAIDYLATKKASEPEAAPDEAEARLLREYTRFGEMVGGFFKDYPCLRECCQQLDVQQYPAALFVSSAMWGTLATRTWYHFYHRPEKERRLNYGIIVIGDPGVGKSFANDLYCEILSPIIAVDEVGNSAMNAYKNEKKLRQDSDKERKKAGIVTPDTRVRIHGARTANNIFIENLVKNTDIVDGKEMHLHLFTFDSELDSATAASKGGQWIDKSIFELKAFHNEEDNQQYRNVDAVNGPFNVFWNYVYTGTPYSLSRKINERNFATGLYGRVAVLPFIGDSFKMLPFLTESKKNKEAIELIREWAYKMDSAKGELPIRPLVYAAWKWTKERMEMAEAEGDKTQVMLLVRVAYYGVNVSVPYILMRHWQEWTTKGTLAIDDRDKDLCRLVMDIQIYSQKFYFYEYAKNYRANSNTENSRKLSANKKTGKTAKAYMALPKVFTLDQATELFDNNRNVARHHCSRWVAEGIIKRVGSEKRSTKYQKIIMQLDE